MRCPMCQAAIDASNPPETRPFCSPRCKKQDLANWLDGVYVLPRDLQPEEIDQLSPEEQEQVFGELLKRHS